MNQQAGPATLNLAPSISYRRPLKHTPADSGTVPQITARLRIRKIALMSSRSSPMAVPSLTSLLFKRRPGIPPGSGLHPLFAPPRPRPSSPSGCTRCPFTVCPSAKARARGVPRVCLLQPSHPHLGSKPDLPPERLSEDNSDALRPRLVGRPG